jgi:hypothetical protein
VAPVDDFGFIDFEAVVVVDGEAGHLADRTVDVEHRAAASADEMVVVVSNTVFVASRRAGRLDPADEVLVDQDAERVVDRLPGNRPELGTHFVAQLVCRGMWVFHNDAHDREPLSGDLHAALAQKFHRCLGHEFIRTRILDFVNNWCLSSSLPRMGRTEPRQPRPA